MQRDAIQKLEDFFAQFRLVRYKKHETIFRPHENPSGVFYLKKGYARLYTVCEAGDELTFIIYKPGDFFPMVWSIDNFPIVYYMAAITPVETLRAPQDKFLEFIKTHPEVLYELTQRILIRMRGLLQRMEQLVFGSAHAKAASIIRICAERFGEKQKDGIVIQVPLTHRDISLLIGLTRETASVEIKKLERKGLIAYCGRLLVVKDKKGIEQESRLT